MINDEIIALSENLGRLLKIRDWTLACAESCTGGLIAAAITDIPGSSAWFECGYVVYSNAAKHHMLGVPERLIAEQGAVSEAVTQAMLTGIFAESGVDLAITVSGIAGPGGGSEKNPVGTLCFSWGTRDKPVSTTQFFTGKRASIRAQATKFGLQQLIDFINEQ